MLSGARLGPATGAKARHTAASCGDWCARDRRVQAGAVRSVQPNSQLLQLQQLQPGQCVTSVCVAEEAVQASLSPPCAAHTTAPAAAGQQLLQQQQDPLHHHAPAEQQHHEQTQLGLFPADVQHEHVQHLLLQQQQQLHHAVLQQHMQLPEAWGSGTQLHQQQQQHLPAVQKLKSDGTPQQPQQLVHGLEQQQQQEQQQEHSIQLTVLHATANGHSLPHTTRLQLDNELAVQPDQLGHTLPSEAPEQQQVQHSVQKLLQRQQQQHRQQQGSLQLPTHGLLVRQQQQQSNLRVQQQQQHGKQRQQHASSPHEQQHHKHSSRRGPVFRVANSTWPKDLAYSLRLWLRQHAEHQEQQEQQQPGIGAEAAAPAAAQVPDVLLCCSSKAALHIALAGVARAAQCMSRLQQPYQLLLQPQLCEQSVVAPSAAADGSSGQRLPEYQLRVAYVPMQQLLPAQPQPHLQQQGRGQEQAQDPQQLQALHQQQQPVGAVSPQHLPQHCKLLQCDHLVSPVPGSSTSSSSQRGKKQHKQQQQRALKQGCADAAEGLPGSSSSSGSSSGLQTAVCPPATSLRQLQSQVVRYVEGRWPTGLCISTAVGALAAFKALVQARGQLAASGCDLFLSPQHMPMLDVAAGVSAGSNKSSRHEACPSGSAVVLWAVAVPKAPADVLPAHVGPVLAAQRHKQQPKQKQQTQPQQQPQRVKQQPLDLQGVAQAHLPAHAVNPQQQQQQQHQHQQVHAAAAPSDVCLPVTLPPLQHCTSPLHGLHANGNGTSKKVAGVAQLPEQLQPC